MQIRKYHYSSLPFARRLKARIEEYWGEDTQENRSRTAELIGVKERTFSTDWCLGHNVPRDLSDKVKVGVFLGMAKDGDDEEGIKRILKYFYSDECRSTPEERAMHIRQRREAARIRKRKGIIYRRRMLKRARKKEEQQ